MSYDHIVWIAMHPKADPEMLGIIPDFLDTNDPRSAREQLDTNYVGGWRPMDGFKLLPGARLKYPDDPPLSPLWRTYLRDEQITLYDHSWVVILQVDGTFEVARLD
jgi:hypothetical protein